MSYSGSSTDTTHHSVPLTSDELPVAANSCSQDLIHKWRTYECSEICPLKDQFQPKCIFISLSWLYNHWDSVPMDVIYHSILIFNAKKEWLCARNNPESNESNQTNQERRLTNKEGATSEMAESKNANHATKPHRLEQTRVLSGNHLLCLKLMNNSSETKLAKFQTLIALKESQNLVLWLDPTSDDESDDDDDDNEIHSNWPTISQFLTAIYDPISQNFCRPIISDLDWWHAKYRSTVQSQRRKVENPFDCYNQLEHCSSFQDICDELILGSIKYRPTMEILRQSNPTLIPICSFDPQTWRIRALAAVAFENYFMESFDNDDSSEMEPELELPFDICELKALRVDINIPDENGFVFLD